MSRWWIVVLLAGSVFVGVPGCGGEEEGGNGAAPAADSGESADSGEGTGAGEGAEAPPAEEGPMTPGEYGEAAAGIQADAIKETVVLMEADLETEELRAKLVALKEGCIEKLVEIGRRRLEMTKDEQKVMDFGIMGGYGRIPKDVYDRYNELYAKHTKDFELANLLSSFNILTQYANFELLKKQEPEEAKRLGVE